MASWTFLSGVMISGWIALVDTIWMIFLSDMTSKIIWGPSPTVRVWSVDSDIAAEWRIRRNEHFVKMIQSRLSDKFANVVVEVVYKDGY